MKRKDFDGGALEAGGRASVDPSVAMLLLLLYCEYVIMKSLTCSS